MLKLQNIKIKKGQISQLTLLIIILISAIVIFLFITKFVAKSTFEESINACRLSVITQSATEVFPSLSGEKSPFDINCDKRYVQFSKNNVKLGLSLTNMKPLAINLEGKKITQFSSLNEFIVNQVVAEELRVCKFQFADGKVDVFGNDDTKIIGWRGKKVCYVCSEIQFDSKINSDKNNPKIFQNLLEYTKNTKFNNNVSYYDYLRSESLEGNIMWRQPDYEPITGISKVMYINLFGNTKQFANLDLNTSKDYLVFFSMYAPLKSNSIIQGETKGQWVAIVPAKDINQYCDNQAS